MPRQTSGPQRETVRRVMHEFKHLELETSHGRKVKNPRHAVAIALHEAGASNQESPQRNRRNLARTKRRDIPGRSRMSKAELQTALRRG